MGIDGLLKLLDPITLKQHISSFRNQIAVIDIMSWIYKGCYRCSFEHNQNIESNNFLYYIFEMLDLLSYYKIKPICVFDGRYVGKKDETIEKRKKLKEENRQKGLLWLQKGNQEEARKYLSRCIIIDDRIITLTMRAFHTKNIEFMVAPYESDSQIAKIVHLGIADFAITQDSDLIVYGVKVMLKLSQDGDCDFIDLNRWKPRDVDTAYLKLFLNMTHMNRVQTAILAGSDYNSSIRGIGIKKAIKHLAERQTSNAVVEHLRNRKPFSENIPVDYQTTILYSKLIFTFATIYNPFNKCLEFLNPHLIDEIKPQGMEIDELKKIVGPFYEYNEDIKDGKINARNLANREIFKIDIKSVFSINSYNLSVRESEYQKRKKQYQEIQKRRQQERANMPEDDDILLVIPKRPKQRKEKAPVVELTQEQKKQLSEQRKAERVQKFSQFKSILNSFKIQESSESQSSMEESEQKDIPQKKDPQPKKKQIKRVSQKTAENTVQRTVREEEQESNSNSFDECLQALNPYDNPWAKRV